MAEATVDCALEVCFLDDDCVAVNAEPPPGSLIQTSNVYVVSGTGQGPAVCYVKNGQNHNGTLTCQDTDGASTGARLGGVAAAAAAWLIIA